jgi:hypothetical protein
MSMPWKPMTGMIFMKGATAYEAQFGRLVIRITHLSGKYWRFRPWRRISIRIWPKDVS